MDLLYETKYMHYTSQHNWWCEMSHIIPPHAVVLLLGPDVKIPAWKRLHYRNEIIPPSTTTAQLPGLASERQRLPQPAPTAPSAIAGVKRRGTNSLVQPRRAAAARGNQRPDPGLFLRHRRKQADSRAQRPALSPTLTPRPTVPDRCSCHPAVLHPAPLHPAPCAWSTQGNYSPCPPLAPPRLQEGGEEEEAEAARRWPPRRTPPHPQPCAGVAQRPVPRLPGARAGPDPKGST